MSAADRSSAPPSVAKRASSADASPRASAETGGTQRRSAKGSLGWQVAGAVAVLLGFSLLSTDHQAFSAAAGMLPPWTSLARKFISLGYPTTTASGSVVYGKGPDDVALSAALFLALMMLQRTFFAVGMPWSRRLLATSGDKAAAKKASTATDEKCHKFLDQLFLFLYYTVSLSSGYYIYRHSPYCPLFENSRFMWTDYPVYQLPGHIKLYYLTQGAFWLQQLFQFVFLTPKQERRKDHWAMTAHHLITSMLVLSSYAFHWTRVGNVVLIVMDVADVFLCSAKCLKYLGKKVETLCNIVFGLFVITWFCTRHVIFAFLMWSLVTEWEIGMGEYHESRWDPYFFRTMRTADDWERPGSYYSRNIVTFYLTLFGGLQILLIYWFALIVKVVYRVIKGNGVDDVREDDEE